MKIVVGLSGGVDSSVALLRLKEASHDVTAVFMKNWEEETAGPCPASVDLLYAKGVCDKLDVPLLTVNFAKEYWDRVFQHFLAEYKAGRTPNPDILCNQEIKFKAFLDYATTLNASHIATGHYAKVCEHNGLYQLCKAKDSNKDQSYFLYTLGQAQLSRTLFPLADLEKPEIRRIAKAAGLMSHNKKDSTGICFIGERRFKPFLQQYLPAQPGDIITDTGKIIGQHEGLMYYTLGQRQGLHIGGQQASSGKPWYVAEKDLAHNQLIVVQGSEHPLLYKKILIASQLHWVSGQAPGDTFECTAKTRYRQEDQACLVTKLTENQLHVTFKNPQRAITPGQSLVLYQNEICLGGAIIENSL